MRGWFTSWRLALRLARRDLVKHRARAIIALVMVTLPVFGVVTADILIQTAKVSPSEGIDRRIGTVATAELVRTGDDQKVVQGADPTDYGDEGDLARPTTLADIERVIGRRTMLPAALHGDALVRTAHGRESVRADQVDASAPLARGLYRLTRGRWPTSTDEVVVNRALLERGVGDTLRVVSPDRSESTRRIVGTIVDASTRDGSVAVGLPGAFPDSSASAAPDDGAAWLVDGPPITWAQVKQLNALGVLVTDRQIAGHPDDYPDPFPSSGIDESTFQVAVLVAVMALIEVVLLAGPAFAVGARKQQRSLALLVASGGTPAQSRRVIIAGGLLLGLCAGLVGVAGGIGLARLLVPAVQHVDGTWLGPFDVPWAHLAAVAAFGLVSALIACVVPAWIASRQNVVAVLAGRRGDARPVRAFPLLGVVLFAIGVLMAVEGARGRGDLMVSWSAVVCVLGMVLLVPVVVMALARVAGRLPLALRFAARDAVRHRTRTTPAVAAVAATVAGVVALGISTGSDALQNRETYQPLLALGNAEVTPSEDFSDVDPSTMDWTKVTDVIRQHVPDARISVVRGVQQSTPAGDYTDVRFQVPGQVDTDVSPAQSRYAEGTDLVVSGAADLPPTLVAALRPGDGVQAALAAGRAVVFSSDTGQARLRQVTISVDVTKADGTLTHVLSKTVPATVVYRGADVSAPLHAILPPALAQGLKLPTVVAGLELDQPHLSNAAQKDLDAALDGLATPATIYVERGYQTKTDALIIQFVLAALAAILMLGGTLTAMFLALSDARPDLATLAAVGADPRTRRGVAASYTFVVAFVGAVLGMLVGFVPGIAITWPLTGQQYPGSKGPYLDIPWLLIGLVVVGLPVLTALLVGACTRSRLPMVSRLS
ncbi:ABC transporter permease [Nocardioides sp. BP30]|uniref:ABC transporter permease n=1 Tax=Nocardioides sp. BP30 TaxID=3036374 RepID=UPI002468A0FF|nr:ABC transporter permease [Nocardioides sp. BP30]WGL52714.1 ABC transporter permease [Nocardioides sp. BP30]